MDIQDRIGLYTSHLGALVVSLNRPADLDILTDLHAGALQAKPWRAFLEHLQRRSAADQASLFFSDDPAEGRGRRWSVSRDRLVGYRRKEPIPLPASFSRLRPNRVYSYEELAEPGEAQTRPAGESLFAFGRIVRIRADDAKWTAWVLIERDAADFGATDSALLSALAPLASITMAHLAVLERERAHSEAAEALLARAGIVWRPLDRRTGATEHERAWSSPLPREAKRAATRLAEQVFTDPADAQRGVRVGGDAPVDLLIVPLSEADLAPGAPAAVVTRRPIEPSAAQARCLEYLWSLSPSEARLAMAIAHGMSLTEAATAQKLSVETARNYSKRIYTKTGARGLADLTRLVLTSIAELA